MSDSTPRLGLPDLPDTPELYADTAADAFGRIDAFTDLYLKGQFVNTPPASPADGDAYLIGASPTGDWSGYAYKLATCRDGGWIMLTPFNGLRGFVEGSNIFIVYCNGAWIDWNALISASESSIASAATCDIEAAGSLFVAVTGTTTITSFGTAANRLRFVRFAGALTLTHNATSLVLPGGASIAAAAGDTALFASDSSGNWRCRHYSRASGVPMNVSAVTGSGAMVLAASPTLSGAPAINAGGDHNIGLGNVSNYNYVSLNGAYTVGGAVGLFGGRDADDALYVQGGSSGLIFRYASGGSATQLGKWDAASGALRINTATALIGSAEMLSVSGTTIAGTFKNNDGSGNGTLAVLNSAASGTRNLMAFYSGAGATNVGSISTTGTATVYNTTSDARLKAVSPRQGDYRDAIRALWVGDFTWTDSGVPGFGVLAQQAWAAMPNHQGVTRPADEEGIWQASAEPFAHLALWGVKDLYALIETLAARVAALEAAHDAG